MLDGLKLHVQIKGPCRVTTIVFQAHPEDSNQTKYQCVIGDVTDDDNDTPYMSGMDHHTAIYNIDLALPEGRVLKVYVSDNCHPFLEVTYPTLVV